LQNQKKGRYPPIEDLCAMAAAKAEAEALPYLFFTSLFFFQLYKMVLDTLL
jgi:hypothetical protein